MMGANEFELQAGDLIEAKIALVNKNALIAIAGRGVRLVVLRRKYQLEIGETWSSDCLIGKVTQFLVQGKHLGFGARGENRYIPEAWSASRPGLTSPLAEKLHSQWVGRSVAAIIQAYHGPKKLPRNYSAYSPDISETILVWEWHGDEIRSIKDVVPCEIFLNSRKGVIHALSGTDEEMIEAKFLFAKIGAHDFLKELNNRHKSQLKCLNEKTRAAAASEHLRLLESPPRRRSSGEVRNDQFLALKSLFSKD